ncbi:MAG: hypothetical protein ACI9UN_000961 [Granulosicoccus sp.]|jgi:hypothetical protein
MVEPLLTLLMMLTSPMAFAGQGCHWPLMLAPVCLAVAV